MKRVKCISLKNIKKVLKIPSLDSFKTFHTIRHLLDRVFMLPTHDDDYYEF